MRRNQLTDVSPEVLQVGSGEEVRHRDVMTECIAKAVGETLMLVEKELEDVSDTPAGHLMAGNQVHGFGKIAKAANRVDLWVGLRSTEWGGKVNLRSARVIVSCSGCKSDRRS